MKIFAVNSSPRGGGQSATELMLNHLVAGMHDAGADVEVVNLREKTIRNCIGCYTCWTKTPGKCIHQDDMTRELYPKWLAADLVVYATPLYYHSMNAAMSAFRERTLPALLPFFEPGNDAKTTHPLRQKYPAMVWLSVCGFPEQSEFQAFSDFMNHARRKDIILAAEIYRSAAGTLMNPLFEDKKKDILEATRKAGRELVQSMKISSETMARITQPIVDPQWFAQMGNLFWKTCIAEKVTPKEFEEKKMVPRPDSMETFMFLLPFGINSEAVGDRKVILQFKFSGEVGGSCYFTIQKGDIQARPGTWDKPDITVETPFELWMDIMTGKADGQQLFMQQKYRVNGDLLLMMNLFQKKNQP